MTRHNRLNHYGNDGTDDGGRHAGAQPDRSEPGANAAAEPHSPARTGASAPGGCRLRSDHRAHTDAEGGTRHIIAVGTAEGRVGCTEAIDVATHYVNTVAPSDVVTIEGWSCEARPDASTPSICTKGGAGHRAARG